MAKRRLMVLGAGVFQVPIIQKAQRMGFETIAVSIPGNYPGFWVADRSYPVDVRDKEQILGIAQQERICGILTDQTDIPVPTVAYVAERMGLPGIGYDCALRFSDKYLMRQLCEASGIPVPRYAQASTLRDAEGHARCLGYPLVVKPVDNQGSRGVTRVDNQRALAQAYQDSMDHSACGRVLLEEFAHGAEIVVHGFVSDYQLTQLAVGDRHYFDLPGLFIPSDSSYPARLGEKLKRRVLEIDRRLIESFNPRFGATYCEYLVDEAAGDIRAGEVAIRGAGVFTSSDLVPLACGIDINELLIRSATGEEDVQVDTDQIRENAAAYVCFSLPEGVIRRVDGVDEVRSLPGVHKTHLEDVRAGRRTQLMADKTMRLGPILVHGQDRAAVDQVIDRIKEILVVEVETAQGVKGIQW